MKAALYQLFYVEETDLSKEIPLRNPILLNPFAAYSAFWLLAILLYQISPSRLNRPLHIGLLLFLIASILISSALAVWFNFKFHNRSFRIRYRRTPLFVLPLLWILYIAEFIYSRDVPLLSAVFGSGEVAYSTFGIPTLHVLISTFSTFFCIYSFFMFLHFRKRLDLALAITTFAFFALIYSRGMLLFLVVSIVLIFLMDKKIRLWHYAALLGLAVVGMWLFGAMGNVRVGGPFYDSALIMEIAQIEGDRYSIFAPFYWVEEYIVCSLRNLNFNIGLHGSGNLTELFCSILPDFIAKRIFPDIDLMSRMLRVTNGLTTGSAYISGYIAFGFFGMTVGLLLFMAIPIFFMHLRPLPDEYKIICLVMLFYLLGMTIFDNMITYSGYSFSIAMALAFAVFRAFYGKLMRRVFHKNRNAS